METNKEWKKKRTKYQCYFGDSLRARNNDDDDDEGDVNNIREKIYRSISLVCSLCIYFCWSIDAWQRHWSSPLYTVQASLFHCFAWRKNGKKWQTVTLHLPSYHANTHEKNKLSNEWAKLLCIYSNCNHYYVVLSAVVDVRGAFIVRDIFVVTMWKQQCNPLGLLII